MLAWKGFNTPDRVKTVALTQPRLSIELREFDPSDYRRLAEIYDAIFPERSRSIDEWRFYDDSLDKSKYYFKRYACLRSTTGEILGFGEMWNPPWMFHPNKFWLDGWVDPKNQGQGVGGAIYGTLESELKRRAATVAWMGIREDMSRPVTFAQKRGFTEKMRGWESTINPLHVDASKFEAYSVKATMAGVEF